MSRVIRFLSLLPLLFVSAAPPPEVHEIPNWPAPPYWTPPAVRAPGEARTQAVSTASALRRLEPVNGRGRDPTGAGFTVR